MKKPETFDEFLAVFITAIKTDDYDFDEIAIHELWEAINAPNKLCKMEDAPTDATGVLAYMSKDKNSYFAPDLIHWCDVDQTFEKDNGERVNAYEYDGWLPLPAVKKESSNGKK